VRHFWSHICTERSILILILGSINSFLWRPREYILQRWFWIMDHHEYAASDYNHQK